MITERISARWVGNRIRLAWTALRPSGSPDASLEDRNIRHLYGEVVWVAVLAAVITFNAPFAMRLGASSAEIGLLVALPALVAILVTLPASSFLSRSRGRVVRVLAWTLFANRAGYLLAAAVPVFLIAHRSTLVIAIFVVFSAPAHFFNVGWNALLADVTPEHRRARVFAMRSIILSLGTTVSVYAAGRWLYWARFPENYQVLYLVGFAAAMVSLYHVSRLQPWAPSTEQSPPKTRLVPPQGLVDLGHKVTAEPQFVRIVVNTLAHGIGVWMVGPVYVLYYLRTLQADEGWLGINGMVATLAPVLGFYLWQRIIAVRGENWVLRLTIMMLGLYPLLVGLTHHLSAILVWTALYGLVAPGVSLSHFNMLLKVIPETDRTIFMGVFITIMNIGAFLTPLLGAFLAERIGSGPTLMLGGVLCVVGSSLFLIWPLTAPDSLAAQAPIVEAPQEQIHV